MTYLPYIRIFILRYRRCYAPFTVGSGFLLPILPLAQLRHRAARLRAARCLTARAARDYCLLHDTPPVAGCLPAGTAVHELRCYRRATRAPLLLYSFSLHAVLSSCCSAVCLCSNAHFHIFHFWRLPFVLSISPSLPHYFLLRTITATLRLLVRATYFLHRTLAARAAHMLLL